jgi:chromosome segregation ATPase
MAAKGVVIVTMAWVALTLTGCVVTAHENLTSSADRLERSSETLAQNTRDEPPAPEYRSAGYSRDARALADKAREFRETLEDRRADDRDVRDSFERLSRRYHDLRDEIEHSGSRRAEADLRPVTEAYLDVERGMGGYREGHRYAREGVTPDRD